MCNARCSINLESYNIIPDTEGPIQNASQSTNVRNPSNAEWKINVGKDRSEKEVYFIVILWCIYSDFRVIEMNLKFYMVFYTIMRSRI